jgi:acyl-CoA thioesterase
MPGLPGRSVLNTGGFVPPSMEPADPVRTMMIADRASSSMGIEIMEYGPGWATAQMTVGAQMVNGHGITHGGFIFALADTAFACACNSWGPVTVAAGADIVFVAPARQSDVLIARADVRSRTGRQGVYDVTVLRGTDVIAEFRGRSHQQRDVAS